MKGIRSGPGAFRGADVNIACLISVGVKVVHGISGRAVVVGATGAGGGGGNITLRNSRAFSLKVV